MNKEIEKRLDKLEEYVSNEMEAIRKLSKKPVKKDLFQITTYEEVCKELKEDLKINPYDKIKQIEKLFNQSWTKNWNDLNQNKYYPYFNLNTTTGVVGFCGSVTLAYGGYGQVAFYKDKQTSDYIGKTFWNIYKEILM